MTRGAAWTVHLSVIAAGTTGVVYGWMRYFCEPDPEAFTIQNHALEDELQAAHIVLVPLLVFACGLLWRTHVWGRIRANYQPRRRTGMVLAFALLPMVLSGYMIQAGPSPFWHDLWIWMHGTTSTLWLLTYAVHQLSSPGENDATPPRFDNKV
tara:strand:+ start:34168 stop:34626 length:459 start_codon:yes stop_codon:yes gene_type:complete